jgi:hypothetical protein
VYMLIFNTLIFFIRCSLISDFWSWHLFDDWTICKCHCSSALFLYFIFRFPLSANSYLSLLGVFCVLWQLWCLYGLACILYIDPWMWKIFPCWKQFSLRITAC